MHLLNESSFIKHEPCPRCGSRDNLGVWSDGHKYCFGCKYYERGFPAFGERALAENLQKNQVQHQGLVHGYSKEIRADARRWLKKYGITDEEIQTRGICWDSAGENLILGWNSENGDFATRRYFGSDPKRPRYLAGPTTKGGKVVFLEPDNSGVSSGRDYRQRIQQDFVVFVEDFISAIRVARFVAACPVFTSTARKALKTAAGRFKGLVWWLDTNMYAKSLLEASRARSVGFPVLGVIQGIHPDPKDHTDEEIERLLSEVSKH